MANNARFNYLIILFMSVISLAASVVLAIALEIYRRLCQQENSRGLPMFFNVFAWIICIIFIAAIIYLIIKRHNYHIRDFVCAGVFTATWGGAAIHYYMLARSAVSPLTTKTIISTYGVFFKEKVVLYGLNSPNDYLDTLIRVHVNFELIISLIMFTIAITVFIVFNKNRVNEFAGQEKH